MVRSGTVPVERKADRSLTSNPAPLTVADVEHEPRGSARRAVMQLIFWAQWGNLPAIVDTYDGRIVERLGVSRITGTYDYLRPEMLSSRPQVISARSSGGGQLVSIEFSSARSAPTREGFVVRRRDGAWRVVYDTLLERAIEGFTIAQAQPGARTPSADARRRGARAAQQYRDAYASLVQRGRASR